MAKDKDKDAPFSKASGAESFARMKKKGGSMTKKTQTDKMSGSHKKGKK